MLLGPAMRIEPKASHTTAKCYQRPSETAVGVSRFAEWVLLIALAKMPGFPPTSKTTAQTEIYRLAKQQYNKSLNLYTSLNFINVFANGRNIIMLSRGNSPAWNFFWTTGSVSSIYGRCKVQISKRTEPTANILVAIIGCWPKWNGC